MDPILTPTMITSALTKLFEGAASEAGKKAWDALNAVILRHRGKAPERPASAEEAGALADDLAAAAREDPAFARDLDVWRHSVVGSDNVMNSVSGTAERVIQGRDFNGTTINFN
ncbi:MAG: hypothetical protein AUG49_19605 [Catenulispora sp. 13_1_20CM_3_70_7]|jgi:hypothetical protein|nr:hypothetical protein [Catenulisporales bacterium]OLE22300.1 MAG: hypothetical protein AUG49_19605 [Catenulispora sp. 13_1_20CM_3_70_7]